MDTVQGLIETYVDQLPEASHRNAYGFPCYFARNKVFGLYDGYALVLKFDPPTVEHLLTTELGKRFRHAASSADMSWVRVNLERLHSQEVLETLIRQSYDYVLGGL
ncbi:MAG: TfoX/Sxy family protein [Chloroflexi bacterium]|nr:TfoX/Sxy family protein [Chloroflexota bacterium]